MFACIHIPHPRFMGFACLIVHQAMQYWIVLQLLRKCKPCVCVLEKSWEILFLKMWQYSRQRTRYWYFSLNVKDTMFSDNELIGLCWLHSSGCKWLFQQKCWKYIVLFWGRGIWWGRELTARNGAVNQQDRPWYAPKSYKYAFNNWSRQYCMIDCSQSVSVTHIYWKGLRASIPRFVQQCPAALNLSSSVSAAMHDLDPIFRQFSRSKKIAEVLTALGFKKPMPIQSMYICKVRRTDSSRLPKSYLVYLANTTACHLV